MTNSLTAILLDDLRAARARRVAPGERDERLAAVYPRSSDKSSARRQAQACMRYAEGRGLKLVRTFGDRSLGSASASGQKGLRKMLRAAARGEFATLVVEDEDRLCRDQSVLEEILLCLDWSGITVQTPALGNLKPRQALVRGVLIEDLRQIDVEHQQSVLRHMAQKGFVAGMRCYGYRSVQDHPYELVVDEVQAAVVARAFSMRRDGAGLGGIAAALNASPEPDVRWTSGRVRSLLRNPLYAGLLVQRRNMTVRDPSTGRRMRVASLQREWTVIPVSRLRLVDDATWDAVKASFGRGHLIA